MVGSVIAGSGIGSNNGVVTGVVSFEDPKNNSILCVKNMIPSEIDSLLSAKAVLAKMGDHNSHLSILCRLLNKPYIVNAKVINKLSCGEIISLDTNTGFIYKK